MTTDRESLRIATRALCKALATYPTALTDAHVRIADQPGQADRGTPPYLLVRVGAIVNEGMDEAVGKYVPLAAAPTRHQRGNRKAAIGLQGVGEATEGWIESIRDRLQLPAARAVMDAQGVEFQNPGGVLNIGTILDVSFEPRFALDLEATFVANVSEATVAAVAIAGGTTLNEQSGSPPHIHTTDTITIP
jgi:hypothetical protein